MIIGHGTIAKVLKDRRDRLYFASGVSDSQNFTREDRLREIDLLLEQDHNAHIVYFSTLSVFYTHSDYITHKRMMERLVKIHFKKYTIMRLGNAVWGDNPVHLIPFIREKIKKGEDMIVEDVYRYPLELDEFLHWVELIPDWNCEMNITSPKMKVIDIIKKYGNAESHS